MAPGVRPEHRRVVAPRVLTTTRGPLWRGKPAKALAPEHAHKGTRRVRVRHGGRGVLQDPHVEGVFDGNRPLLKCLHESGHVKGTRRLVDKVLNAQIARAGLCGTTAVMMIVRMAFVGTVWIGASVVVIIMRVRVCMAGVGAMGVGAGGGGGGCCGSIIVVVLVGLYFSWLRSTSPSSSLRVFLPSTVGVTHIVKMKMYLVLKKIVKTTIG